jgi:hypothetical protein
VSEQTDLVRVERSRHPIVADHAFLHQTILASSSNISDGFNVHGRASRNYPTTPNPLLNIGSSPTGQSKIGGLGQPR